MFYYIFSENGLATYQQGVCVHKKELIDELGNEASKDIANYTLRYLSDVVLPFKRGTFFEYRTGLINICPMGRNCTLDERYLFDAFNKEHKVLEKLRDDLDAQFSEKYNVLVCFGGQVSVDIFMKGWDKTYCLQFLEGCDIVFFGDKVFKVMFD